MCKISSWETEILREIKEDLNKWNNVQRIGILIIIKIPFLPPDSVQS